MRNINPIDKDVAKFEKELIEFMIRSPLFFDQNQIFSMIKSYFITRKYLDQASIRKITGLSAGKVSQELQNLIKMGMIEENKLNNSRKIIYSMDSIQKSFIASAINAVKEIAEWQSNLRKIKEELDRDKEELQKLKGYHDIYKIVNLFSMSLPLNEKMLEKLQEYYDK
jgi:DNA-binding transcriptional regulator GbsR (MarR family)